MNRDNYTLICLFVLIICLPYTLTAKRISLSNPFSFAEANSITTRVQELTKEMNFQQSLFSFMKEVELKGSQKEKFSVYIQGGLTLWQTGNIKMASGIINKAILILDQVKTTDAQKGQLYYALSKIQFKNGEYNDAEISLSKSIDYISNIKDKKYLSDLIIEQGLLSVDIKNYLGALNLFARAKEIAKDNNDTINIADAYYYSGTTLKKRGNYDQALESLILAQQQYALAGDQKGICASLVNTADIFYQLNDVNQALTLYFKALDNCHYSDSCVYLDNCYLKIGEIYMKKLQMEEALDYLNKYQSLTESKNDTLGIAMAKGAFGKFYAQQKNFSKSIIALHEAIDLINKHPDVSVEGDLLLTLSQVYIQTRDLFQAKSYAQKALIIASTLDEKKLKADCYHVFSKLYELQGDYRSAFYYKNKGVDIKDSILNEDTLLALRKLSGLKENDKDKRVIKELEEENISLNNYWLKEKNKRYLLLITTVLLLVFTIVLFALFRAKAKVEKKLKLKNGELEKLNATKDKFFSIIAHDLKSPFNSLMGFSEMLSLHAESKSYKDIMEYSGIIHNSTRKLFSLVDTLLQWSRTQLGTTEYKPERLEIAIVSSNIVSILKINAEEKDIVISVDIDNHLVGWADKDLYSAVLRNLISNAIKFSRVGSVITVTAKTKKQFIEVSVSDTGVGITKENLAKIFNVDKNVSTKGTFNEKGTGLGLVLCKEFVEINRGTIWAESRLEKGSTFKFTVPLVK
ncbi:ATP-binding protein [Plebeiibacterium sediminum]|uniref:histidine kinase n=1 Tax=Plebeiibacterium sediminum TaxID=2992112 RepID=A0AAE3M1T6_9BACT|nr:ATP-binding protein [Plebeiobacterium sediminum]MCW3785647.1 ATP-binding protein [Plebeiobacterium sediminum]